MSTQGLFLPYAAKGKATELQAIRVKRLLGLGPYSSVNPTAVLSRIPARVMDESEFSGAPASVREVLFGRDDDSISGIGFGRSPATDEWLVHINPSHHVHRQRVTLMEEVVHIVLDHPKSQLTIDPRTGKWQRSFDKNVEEEAYGVGAACIIPYKALFFAIKYDHDVISTLAERYNVSEEYMYFRIKLSGLLNVYRKNSGPT